MNRKSFSYLLIVTALVVIAAFWVGSKSENKDQSGQKLFPDLAQHINDVSEISGTTNEGTFTLLRQDNNWVVKESSNYGSDKVVVQNFLRGVNNLKRLQAKTSNPELYKKIELQEVTVKGSKSVRYVLKKDDKVVADLLFGKQRPAKSDRTRDEFYVRLLDDPQSWLVEGKVKLLKSADDWLDQNVLEVDRSRIRQVTVTHTGAEQVVVRREKRTDRDYTLIDVPEGVKIDSQFAVNDVANSFASIKMEAVHPNSVVNIDDGSGIKAVMETFDGLRVVMRTAKKADTTYVNYEAVFDPLIAVVEKPSEDSKQEGSNEGTKEKVIDGPKPVIKTGDQVKAEIASLNQRWKGWVYKLPEFKLNNITKPKADLYAKKKEEDSGQPASDTETNSK